MKTNITLLSLLGLSLAAPLYAAAPAENKDTPPAHCEKRMKAVDTNSDGKISKAEFLAGAEKRFAKTDANGDGQITKEEHKAMREQWHKKHPRPPHGNPPVEGK